MKGNPDVIPVITISNKDGTNIDNYINYFTIYLLEKNGIKLI